MKERSDNMLLGKRFIDTVISAITHRCNFLIGDRVVFNSSISSMNKLNDFR